MRQAFIPLFQDIRTSSLWALDQSTPGALRVWITLLTLVDPKGYVCAALPGLAVAACLPLDVVARCIEVFESPDPYSRTSTHEGRRLEKVERGWRVLNYEAMVDRARNESHKAAKRRWAKAHYADKLEGERAIGFTEGYDRATANDTAPPDDVESRLVPSRSDMKPQNLDRSRSRSRSSLSEEGSPLPPVVDEERLERWAEHTLPVPSAAVFEAPTLPAVIRKLSDWHPKEGELDALRDAAKLAGVKNFDHWLAQLGSGPIGGARGVLPDMVGDYLHQQFARWRKWEETDAFKDANSRAAPGSGSGFRGYPAPPPGPQRKRVPGAPDWVYVEHAETASAHGVKLGRAAKAFAESYHLGDPGTLKPADVFQPFMKFIEEFAKQKESA